MRMTVECTEREKEFLINTLNEDCPFMHDDNIKCIWIENDLKRMTLKEACAKCIEENIEWRTV